MKRGLITWDQTELPRSVFDRRLAEARAALAERDLPALLIYTDIWRANQARYFTNFMPYWNRSLAVIPQNGAPVLLCGLSPRVYPWIRSVTIFEDIRPAGKLVPTLRKLCEERAWTHLGVLDLPRVPHEVHGPLSQTPIQLTNIALPITDDADLSMRRHALDLARRILAGHLPQGAGLTDHQFTGRLERAFRRAGAEDLVVLISAGGTVPRPASGRPLGARYSVSIALEYRGHWIKLTRAQAEPAAQAALEARFAEGGGVTETLAGPYPFEPGTGAVTARQVEIVHDGTRLFHGDTIF